VYIIAHCSSLNRTTFFSLYVCCPVLDLTDMSPPTGPEIALRMKDRVLRQIDWSKPPRCLNPKRTAYTDVRDRKFQICRKGIDYRDLSKLTCDDLDKPRRGKQTDRMSSKKISSIAGTMLHEAT
jgi:hypothetical protein